MLPAAPPPIAGGARRQALARPEAAARALPGTPRGGQAERGRLRPCSGEAPRRPMRVQPGGARGRGAGGAVVRGEGRGSSASATHASSRGWLQHFPQLPHRLAPFLSGAGKCALLRGFPKIAVRGSLTREIEGSVSLRDGVASLGEAPSRRRRLIPAARGPSFTSSPRPVRQENLLCCPRSPWLHRARCLEDVPKDPGRQGFDPPPHRTHTRPKGATPEALLRSFWGKKRSRFSRAQENQTMLGGISGSQARQRILTGRTGRTPNHPIHSSTYGGYAGGHSRTFSSSSPPKYLGGAWQLPRTLGRPYHSETPP